MLRRFIVMASLMAMFSSLHADLWDDAVNMNVQKYSRRNGVRYRFNAGFGPQRTPAPKTIKWFDIQSRGGTSGNDCGSLNFGGQLKVMFNKNALEEYLGGIEALVSQLIAGAPMLILQTVDPQLAEALKHLKSMANATMRTRMGQCKDLFKAASDVGRKIFGEGRADCHSAATGAGEETGNATESCSDYKRFPKLDSLAGNFRESVNYSKDILGKAEGFFGGFNSKENPTLAGNIFQGLFGTTELDVNGKAAFTTNPGNTMMVAKKDKVDRAAEHAEAAIAAIKSGSSVSDEDLKALSTPGYPLTVDTLVAISMMPQEEQDFYVSNIASVVGHYKQLEELYDMKHKVTQTGQLPDVKKYKEAGLGDFDKAIEMLDNDIERLEKQILNEDRVRINRMRTMTTIEGQFVSREAQVHENFRRQNEAIDSYNYGFGTMMTTRKASQLRSDDGLPPFD